MKNKTFEKNLDALEARLPGWKDYLVHKEYIKVDKELREKGQKDFLLKRVTISEEKAYTGEQIDVVKYGKNTYYLAGKYGPEEMARLRAERIKDQGFGSLLFIIGFSDGRMLKYLMERVSEDTTVIVYEPSMKIFLHAMESYDLTSLFEGKLPGLIIDGINNQELQSIIDSRITVESMTKISIVITHNYDKLFPAQTKDVMDAIKKRITGVRTNWNTILNFANDSIFNELRNLTLLYKHYNICDFFHTIPEDVPVIVVAAGPSLDKNIDQLKKAKGKACIIACDTALKPLFRHGITPDFFAVVDPRKDLELFEMKKTNTVPMISGINIPYKLVKSHQGDKIVYYDSYTQDMVFEEVFKEDPVKQKRLNSVATGGSVATSAFSVGIMMGARTIILVGQDLALTGNREHASGTFKKDRTHDIENNKEYIQVEGIDGKKIPTLTNLNLYRIWFEDQIKKYKDTVKVVDATEGGALIHGSEVMTLEDAIEQYCKGKYSRKRLMKKIPYHFNEEEQRHALQLYSELPDRIRKLDIEVTKGLKTYEKLRRITGKKKYTSEELSKVLTKIKKFNKKMDRDNLASLIMSGLPGVDYTLRSTVYTLKDDERAELRESAEVGIVFLNSMKVVIDQILPVAEEVSQEAKQMQERDFPEGEV
ncbi:MAG: motility associated factor glycosyltransferase family protein [Lachnospiraceae bacterium]